MAPGFSYFPVAPRVGVMGFHSSAQPTDSHVFVPQVELMVIPALVWALVFMLRTPTFWCSPWNWVRGLTSFGLTSGLGVADSHDLLGPRSCGEGLPNYSVAPQTRVTDSQVSAWPLELVLWTPTLQRGPLSRGDGLPNFGAAPRVRVKDSYAAALPLRLV